MTNQEQVLQVLSIVYPIAVLSITTLRMLSGRVKHLRSFDCVPLLLIAILWAPIISLIAMILLGLTMLGNMH